MIRISRTGARAAVMARLAAAACLSWTLLAGPVAAQTPPAPVVIRNVRILDLSGPNRDRPAA